MPARAQSLMNLICFFFFFSRLVWDDVRQSIKVGADARTHTSAPPIPLAAEDRAKLKKGSFDDSASGVGLCCSSFPFCAFRYRMLCDGA